MKKLFTLLSASALMFTASFAQNRYVDEVFTGVDITSDVKYAENYSVLTGTPVLTNLLMDVYEPQGDTITERPLIVLAHAGSFLPECQANTLPLGSKSDSSLVEMCKQFARRGYVAVSMDYRLGWNPISTDADVRAGTIINAVFRGIQDMKACVRYFKLSANQSAYGIDTNRIVVGGSNSGGYMALGYGAVNDSSELELLKFRNSQTGNPYVDLNVVGDWDGRGGMMGVNKYENAGPSSDAHMVLNLGGAIGDTSWQNAGEVPIVAFHGVQDALTPYKTNVVIVAATGQSVVEVSGSHDLARYATSLGNQDDLNDQFFSDAISQEAAARTPHKGLYPFPGAANGYEPWAWYNENSPCIDTTGTGFGSAANPFATKTKALAYIDTIMGYFCPRAVQVLQLPGNTVGVKDIDMISNAVKMYPNPATTEINVVSDIDVTSASLIDINGRMVWSNMNERQNRFRIDVSRFESGFYFLRLETEEGIVNKKVVVN